MDIEGKVTPAMQGSRQWSGHSYSRYLRFWTEERSLTVMLVLLLLHFFVLSPGTTLGRAYQLVAALFLSFALFAGILALEQQVVRLLGLLLVAGAIAFRSAAIFGDAPWLIVGDTLFSLLCLVSLIVIVFR